MLFTIRVWTSPLSVVLADPDRAARFAHAWRTAHPDFRDYKHLGLYGYRAEDVIQKMSVKALYPGNGAKEVGRMLRSRSGGGVGRL